MGEYLWGLLRRQMLCQKWLITSDGYSFPLIAAESLHRRASRFPATLWRENRDTSSKPPRFIRHRRRFGGFRQRPMVSGLPLPSRALLVMGCSGNRLSNRPAAAPVQAKGACASTGLGIRIPTTSLRLMLTVVSSGFLLRHCQASAHTGCGDPSPTVEQQASSTTQ